MKKLKLPKLKLPKIKLTKKTIIFLLLIIIIIAAGLFLFKDKLNLEKKIDTQVTQGQVKQAKDWELILVNKDNLLSQDFKVTLQNINGEKIDARISESLKAMEDSAKEAGISLILCSGYRSVSRQKQLYEQEIAANKAAGLDEQSSIELAGEYINPPGSSEHHTGLAIDYLTDGHIQLTESFSQTPAYSWLQANAHTFGFIERYPKGKEEITKVNWEPWHYRYVGIEHATKIKEQNLCLEEYLDQ